MNNIDIAILARVNDLAERYDLKPYDFIATLDNSMTMDGCGLVFVIPGATNERQEANARKMFAAIGVGDDGVLKGGEFAVIDAFDDALHLAPKPRPRS